ncbi:phosphatase PAP2 family protein [Rhizorhabdus sp.]|uniref:phosphatase PAP2 family protein n=1 Tax=Rhizorhabdus sp. TaxID=1968843 RepID=UPI0019BFB798|nr:phosphatase PAP2 family protein [Rhizorhabdus sp.]MBD3761336.1 phosphatase PAP2 family protein [Rhizorhabdus sp.]
MRLSSILALAGLSMLAAGLSLWLLSPRLDLLLFERIRLEAGNDGVAPFQFFTAIGGFAVLGPLALLIAAWLIARRHHALALWLFAVIGSGRLMIEAMKALVARPRPPLADRLTEVSTHSFPSSHAAGTLLTWLAIAMLFPALRRWLLPFALIMAAGIGWSRIALGVHWPSDVLAGYGLALLWVGVAARWLPAPPEAVSRA